MISRAAIALVALSLHPSSIVASEKQKQQSSSQPAWQTFGSNVNYRITAVLDINGGADAGPNFETFTNTADTYSGSGGKPAGDGKDNYESVQGNASTESVKTPGYSVPIDVLTLQDPTTGKYRQRISYYGGMQVDYNMDGMGYKVVSTPYTTEGDDSSPSSDGGKVNTCFFVGGNSTVESEKQGYLNFFPTVEQMEHYTLGKLVTTEPGVPYRIATLEAPHGSTDATSDPSQPDASYGTRPGMPSNDWFQFHYEESLSSANNKAATAAARPLKWTMLARNQIINAHTENWVIRYLSYENIDEDDEGKLWEGWFDAKFDGACGDDEDRNMALLADDDDGEKKLKKLNRLGMFFSESSSHHHQSSRDNIPTMADSSSRAEGPSSSSSSSLSHFDVFLARHNRHYPRNTRDYFERKAIHDANVENVERWNEEHAGKTAFVHNEFMDMEVKEVMEFRGGHIPRRVDNNKSKPRRRAEDGHSGDDVKRNLRQSAIVILPEDDDPDSSASSSSADDDDDDDDDEEYKFPEHEVPKNFDPSTLPQEFDWRDHLPGSVGPIKDQGFCGSCWAFSFISAMESHWYIANGGQTPVDLPEQFVNDCAWSYNTHACDGGDSAFAAKVIIDKFQGKVPTRDEYGGYLSVDGGCYVDILQDVGVMGDNGLLSTPSSTVQLSDWVLLPKRDDIAAKHALFTKGPLAVALNVVDEAMYYASGVLDVESCSKHDAMNLDHAINLVGWGVDTLPDGTQAEHWILRNSWSDLWGDSGYFKVRMGDRDCGVTTSAGYPLVLGTTMHGLVESQKHTATS